MTTNRRGVKTKRSAYKPDEAPITEFFFKPKRKRVDWRLLANVDVDKIIQETDITHLQKLIETVTFCDLKAEGLENIDSSAIKLFQISQLIIEFLLHSQTHLLKQQEITRTDYETILEDQKVTLERETILKSQLDDLKKELKTLKKTLFAYQLVSKIPGNSDQPGMPKNVVYHKCRHCTKVFSSDHYLLAHEQRRHPDMIQISAIEEAPVNIQPKETESVKELKRVAELIESFTSKLVEKEQNKLIDDKNKQERLRFEEELQKLKAAMHQEIEEEKNMLRKDRQALETLVHSQTAKLPTMGSLEDDDDDSNLNVANVKKKKSKELETDKKLSKEQSKVLIEEAILVEKQRYHEEFQDMKALFLEELNNVRSTMQAQNETNSHILETKLDIAKREIESLRNKFATTLRSELDSERDRLKAEMEQKIQKQFSEHEMKEVAKGKETTMTTAIPSKQVNAVEIPQMTAKEIREEPRQKPVDEIIKRGNSPKPINPVSSVKEKKKIEGIDWKDCVKVLNMHTHVPNPHSKFASSIFHHPVTEINNQKNIFKLEVEQFLASHGVTQTAMAQKHKNPAMKIICEQLSELIDDHRQKSTTIACYDQMRNFISTQIDAASSQGYRTGPPPLKIDTGVKSSLVSLKSPRTSSSPTKSVKISDEAKLETKQRNYPRKWYFEDRASDDAKSISDTSPSRSSISSNSRAQSPSDEIEPQTSPTKSSGPMASIKRSFSIKAKETIFNTFKDVASKMNPLRRKQSADERFQSMILEQSKMVQSPSMITAPIQSPTEKKRREDDSSSTETEGSESEEDESSDGIYSSIKASRTETSASETASSISNKTPSKAVPRSVPKSNTLLEALNEEEEGAEVPKVFKSKITLKPTKAVNNNRNTETSQTQSSSCASSLSDFPISEISAPITPPEKRNPDVTDAQSDPPSEEMIDFLNNMNTKVEVLNQAPQKTQQSQQIMVFDDISDFDD